jgi:hypothetical protein
LAPAAGLWRRPRGFGAGRGALASIVGFGVDLGEKHIIRSLFVCFCP